MSRSSILLIFLLLALPLDAQTLPRRTAAGYGAGGAIGMQSGTFGVYPGSTSCGIFESARVGSYWFGGTVFVPALFADRWGLAADVRWNRSSAVYVAVPVETRVVFDSEVGKVVEIPREYRYSFDGSTAMLDLLLRWDAGNAFAVAVGGWAGLRSELSFAQVERSLDARYLFADGMPDTAMQPGIIPTREAIGYGLLFAATYEIRLSSTLFLQPEMTIRFDPGTEIREASWQRLALEAGMSVMIDLFPAAQPEALPAIVAEPVVLPEEPEAEPQPRRIPVLTASLDLRAVDTLENDIPAANVTIYETRIRQVVPMPDYVAFPLNSATLSEPYRMLPAAGATAGILDSLGEGTSGVEAHLLNLLGLRLRQSPAAQIALTGATARNEAGWLAYARVEAIRSYLESIWGIDPGRIDVRAPEELVTRRRNDRPGVVISGPGSIVGAVELVRTDREFEPPRIRIVPAWEAEAGVRNWSIRFQHGGTTIGDVDGTGEKGDGITALNWQILDIPPGGTAAPLSAELIVEDSLGNIRRVADSIPLRVERRSRVVHHSIDRNGGERAIYTLYPTNSRQRNIDLVSRLVARLPHGSKVSVAGSGDPGDEQVAWLLSEARGHVASGSGVTVARRVQRLTAAELATIADIDGIGSAALVVELPNAR